MLCGCSLNVFGRTERMVPNELSLGKEHCCLSLVSLVRDPIPELDFWSVI